MEPCKKLDESGFKIFASNEAEVPISPIIRDTLQGDTYYYHVQGGKNAEPIENVRTGLTETPDNLKQIAENTATASESDQITYNNIFNYYPEGSATGAKIRNPLDFCREDGPC